MTGTSTVGNIDCNSATLGTEGGEVGCTTGTLVRGVVVGSSREVGVGVLAGIVGPDVGLGEVGDVAMVVMSYDEQWQNVVELRCFKTDLLEMAVLPAASFDDATGLFSPVADHQYQVQQMVSRHNSLTHTVSSSGVLTHTISLLPTASASCNWRTKSSISLRFTLL